MKRAAFAFAVLATLFVSLIALAHVVDEPTLARAVIPPREAPPQARTATPAAEAAEPVEPEGTGELAGYVLEAMIAWMPPRNAAPSTHLASIARDIAWTAIAEPRVWDGSNGAREAILLARIAWFETLFRDYVDDGSCQVWAQQALAHGTASLPKSARELMLLGTCDGGQAVGVWQVHYECGSITLYEDGTWQNGCTVPDRTRLHWVVMRGEALDSRRAQARVALAMARQSIRAGAGLRNYVGGDGSERALMAAQRLDSAETWSKAHPFRP